MTYILISIIVLLTFCIIWLSVNQLRMRRETNTRISELNLQILAMNTANDDQSVQLRLWDDFRNQLHKARLALDRDLIALQTDNLAMLSKNNLLD